MKEADASDDGYRATTLSHSAKPSSESVMPPSVSAPQLNPAPHSTAPLQADEAMEVKEADASDDGHRATTLFHSARPSSESAVPPSAPQADSPPPAMLPTTTESSDLLESSVSSPPAPSETKEASSADQPRLVVTTPFSSPNPFALLDDDCKEKVAPMDVRRASIPVPSACSSSVATASRASSKMDAKFNYMAARIRKPKPVVAVDESTVTKRPCTRAHPATASTHGFFQRLATRSGAVRAHFEKHYLSTSRMCPCDLFPVYASKVEGVPTLPPELNAYSATFPSPPSAASAMMACTIPVRRRAAAAELPRLRKCEGQVWMEGSVVQHSKQRRGVLVQVLSMGLTLHTVQ